MDKEVLRDSEGASASATEIRRKKLFVAERLYMQAREEGQPVTMTSISSEVDLNRRTVQRLVHGEVDFRASSAGGRTTLLANAEELFIEMRIKEGAKHGIYFDLEYIRSLASDIYLETLARLGEPPRDTSRMFTQTWWSGFRHRHPDVHLQPAEVVNAQRFVAEERKNVDHCLQTVKNVFHRHLKIEDGYFFSRDALFFDEKAINGHASYSPQKGGYFTTFEGVQPRIAVPSEGTRATVGVLANFAGEVIATTICTSEPAPKFDPNKCINCPEEVKLMRNTAGSMKSGTLECRGSWTANAAHWIEQIHKRYTNNRRPLVIILDGAPVHFDPDVLKILLDQNIHVAFLSPNLTHVLQISDHPLLHGRMENLVQRYRQDASLRSIDLGKLESACHVLSIVHQCFTPDGISHAISALAFEYKPDSALGQCKITNDTIKEFLNKAESRGKVHSSISVDDAAGMPLRRDFFLDGMKLEECGILQSLNLPLVDQVKFAIEHEDPKGRRSSVKVVHRFVPSSLAEVKGYDADTTVYDNAMFREALDERVAEKRVKEQAHEAAATRKRLKHEGAAVNSSSSRSVTAKTVDKLVGTIPLGNSPITKKVVRASTQVMDERDARVKVVELEAALKENLIDIDWKTYKKSFDRYFTGTCDLQWAIEIAAKKLRLENRSKPQTAARIERDGDLEYDGSN